MASPAEMLRVLLINAGLVEYPSGQDQDTHSPIPQCHVNTMPNEPPIVVALADTVGVVFGRLMEGQTLQHHGVKINVRHSDSRLGHDSIKAIHKLIDEMPPMQQVTSRGMACFIQSVYNASSIVSLGEEPGTQRHLWSLNVRMAAGQLQP